MVSSPDKQHRSELYADIYEPIPIDAGNVDHWKQVEIKVVQNREPLVPLGSFSRDMGDILTSSVYFGEHNSSPYIQEANTINGSLLTLFTREGVAHRLLKAQQHLPFGHRLIVFDAYRPLEVQESLFHFYRKNLCNQMPHMTDDELNNETQKYVSMPSRDISRPSPHNTGGSVDLAIVKLPDEYAWQVQTISDRLDLPMELVGIDERITLEIQKASIVRRHAELLDFGTAFDHGGERAGLAYFEKKLAEGIILSQDEMNACMNRRMLYDAMTRSGMQAYESEWWHFNAPESQMGAVTAGLNVASYGAMSLNEENVAHEEARREILRQTIRIQEEKMGQLGGIGVRNCIETAISCALEDTGDPRLAAGFWPTEIITPQF